MSIMGMRVVKLIIDFKKKSKTKVSGNDVPLTFYIVEIIKYTNPARTDAVIPYTNTGPAITNIFEARPRTKPSLLNSIAGETIAFENPVIGTIVPAPANFAIRSYTPIPVKTAPINIKVEGVAILTVSSANPSFSYPSDMS